MSPRWLGTWVLLAVLLQCGGCRSLLPKSEASDSPFRSFEEAMAAFDAIVPHVTTADELRALKIDPEERGTDIFPFTAVAHFFLPHAGASFELHDPAVRHCVEARDRCQAWLVTAERSKGKRDSNLILDVLRIHRLKRIRGFYFEGMVLVVDDVATFQLYRGRPALRTVEQEVRPLGLLQDGPKVAVDFARGGGATLSFGGTALGGLEARGPDSIEIQGFFEAEDLRKGQTTSTSESASDLLDPPESSP